MNTPATNYIGDRPCLPPWAYPTLAQTTTPTLSPRTSLLNRMVDWLRGCRV